MNFPAKNVIRKKVDQIFKIKTLKNTLLIALILMSPFIVKAQEEKSTQAYLVHEDRVKPGMIDEYEQISKELVSACKEYNIQDLNWLAASQDDHTYLYLTPMEKFAELDINSFATLSEKMGKEKMTALFQRFNACYDEHGDYVVYLQKDLSYQPGGINPNPEGKYYRKFMYDYVTPSHQKAYVENLKEIKKLFVKKNSKMNYRIYSSGFGTIEKYYMIVIEGEDPVSFETMAAENWEDMGEDFQPLVGKIRANILRSDEKTGWIMGDLSYLPKK